MVRKIRHTEQSISFRKGDNACAEHLIDLLCTVASTTLVIYRAVCYCLLRWRADSLSRTYGLELVDRGGCSNDTMEMTTIARCLAHLGLKVSLPTLSG